MKIRARIGCGAVLALLTVVSAGLAQEAPARKTVGERFRELDGNRDGVLTKDEVPAQMPFVEVDRNKDGKVTSVEVMEYFRARRARQRGPERPAYRPEPVPMKKTLNVPYAEVEGVDPNLLSLDIYAPAMGGHHPVMVMIHGGSWSKGDKAAPGMVALKAPWFVGEGYVYVSINYRLSPAVQHPVHVQDVAKALAWVHTNIAPHGGDPDRIFVMGHSAGAHLAALVATDRKRLKAEGKKLSILKGVIPLDVGVYDLPRNFELREEWKMGGRDILEGVFTDKPKLQRNASPMHHLKRGKKIPPFLIYHTSREFTKVLTEEFAAGLEQAGVPVEVVEAADKDHAGVNRTIGNPTERYTPILMKFLEARGGNESPPGGSG